MKIVRSPFFYVGDKYKLLKEIKPYFPNKIDNFFEPFVGGGSVFLNVEANNYYLNDIDKNVYNLHLFLKSQVENKNFFNQVLEVAKKYNLSRSFYEDIVPKELKKEYKKTYYSKFNQIGFNKLKQQFNSQTKKDYFILYLLVIYGFNRIIRFNSKGEFNVPVGNVDFNKNVKMALLNYFEFMKNNKVKFENKDFKKFLDNYQLKKEDFIYFDPPYLITFSEYNKLWNEKKEKELLELLDSLNKNNIKFAISNVVFYKGKKNNLFIEWMKNYNVKKIKSNYISYHDNSIKNFEEVLVLNY